MKLFGKEVSSKVKRDLIMRLVMIVISGTIIAVFAFNSVAWFSSISKLSTTGMQIVVDCGTFEIAVVSPRSAEYDRYTTEYFRRYVEPGDSENRDRRYDLIARDDADGLYVTADSSGDATVILDSDPYYFRRYIFPDDDGETRYNITAEKNTSDGLFIKLENSTGATDTVVKELYPGTLAMKSYLAGEEYSLTQNFTDGNTPSIAFEMVNENIDTTNNNTRFLRPGSYGYVSFYVLPKTGERADGTRYTFSINIGGLLYNGNAVEEYDGEDKNTLLNILKGHILLFGTYEDTNDDDEKEYNNQITDRFTYTAAVSDWTTNIGGSGRNGYLVKYYWIWPLTYNSIMSNIGANKLYPPALKTYVSDNPLYFFNEAEPEEEKKGGYYNNCDQKIGDAYDFLVLYMTATQG